MIDTRAMLIWAAGGVLTASLSTGPLSSALILLAASAVAAGAPDRRLFRALVLIGLFALALRTALFTLTGHFGSQVVFELPAATLPGVLGGQRLGGPVTAEAAIAALSEGSKLVAVLAVFGAFVSLVRRSEIIRLIPRFAFDAGLVIAIALAFAPNLIRTWRDIREAQRMRGSRRVHLTLLPLLATSLERSINLGQSMDARGYGRVPPERAAEARLRAGAAVSAAALLGAGSLWLLGRGAPLTAAVTVSAAACLGWILWRLTKAVPRSHYRRQHVQLGDVAVGAAAVAAAATATLLGDSVQIIGPALLLAAPAIVAARRAAA